MHVQNMVNSNDRAVPNQFIITEEGRSALGNFTRRRTFQSYSSVIAEITEWPDKTYTRLDKYYWDYSKTTGKYRNIFLGETKKETEAKIKSGEYVLADLN